MAQPRRRRDFDIAGAARLSAFRDRLAQSPENLAADLGGLTFLLWKYLRSMFLLRYDFRP
jgi:hypothetical protein